MNETAELHAAFLTNQILFAMVFHYKVCGEFHKNEIIACSRLL